jgi:hypothetical protein
MRDPRIIAEHAIIYPLHPETPAKSIQQYADILDPVQVTKGKVLFLLFRFHPCFLIFYAIFCIVDFFSTNCMVS